MSITGDGLAVGTARLDGDGPDYIEVTDGQYAVTFATGLDADGFVDAVEADGGTDGYTIQQGEDWAEAGMKERVDDPDAVRERDTVYVAEESDQPFSRSYLVGTDRDEAEITVAVPERLGGYDVTPLYDALEPFYDDGEIVDAVEAVETELDAFEDGDNEMIRI